MDEIIRLIEEKDLDSCAKLLEEAYSDEPYNEKFHEGMALNYIKSKFYNGKDHSFVLIVNGEVKGFAFASLSYWSNGPQAIMEECLGQHMKLVTGIM